MHSDDLALEPWRSGSSSTVTERHGHAQPAMPLNPIAHALPSLTGRLPESRNQQRESSKQCSVPL